MEATKIKKIQKLQEMVKTHFTTLKPDKQEKDRFRVSFTVSDYTHLMFIISDLMKLCISSIEEEISYDSSSIVHSRVNITQILEIAIELLPINEAEFLDHSRELFSKKGENDAAEN